MIQILRHNTLSVFSSNGNTLGGHQRILVDVVDYIIEIAPANWIDPVPPLALVPWVAGNNIAQVDRDNANYQLQFREYTLFKATIEACNADIFGCMPIDYLGALKDPLLGFSHLQTWTIIQHLLANYGEMTADDIRICHEELRAPFDPTPQSMESLFIRGRDCQADCAHIDPISEMTKINAIHRVLELSGHYTLALQRWDAKAAAQQTYPLMTTYFVQVERARKRELTTADAGFHAANLVAGAPATTTRLPSLPASITGYGYCFSHGLTNNPTHTSLTCTNLVHNHNREATLANMMGGNQTIRRRINETAVYQSGSNNPNYRQNNNNNNNRRNNNNNNNNNNNTNAANQPAT